MRAVLKGRGFQPRRRGWTLGGAALQRCDKGPIFISGFSRCGTSGAKAHSSCQLHRRPGRPAPPKISATLSFPTACEGGSGYMYNLVRTIQYILQVKLPPPLHIATWLPPRMPFPEAETALASTISPRSALIIIQDGFRAPAPPKRVLRIFNHLHEGSTTYEHLHFGHAGWHH